MNHNPKNRRNAFTLIELLTVMAIITLLIGILTPALGAARDRARSTAVRAQLNAMGIGLESFHGDEQKYVPSNPFNFARVPNDPMAAAEIANEWELANGSAIMQGAHLLVDAMVGRDFLGYDPKPTNTTVTPNYDRWAATNDRRQPYIPPDGVDVTSTDKPPEDGFGRIPAGPGGILPQPTINNVLCRVFRDKFGWPILYYRASPSANQNTPIIQTTAGAILNTGDGVFDGRDNEAFTSYDQTNCLGGGAAPSNLAHRICDARTGLDDQSPTWPGQSLPHRFAEFIRSLRGSTYQPPPNDKLISRPRPVKADRFILLSAGKDGIYGTLDDVANFDVLSTER